MGISGVQSAIAGFILVSSLFGGLAVDLSGDGLRTYEDFLHHTSPLDTDTDADGLSDYEEVHIYGSDPTDTDTDNDRLSDSDEVNEYGSDPTKSRTTRPLPDGKEVKEYGLDPSTADTDGDGASDHTEVMEVDSDPHEPDTDGDGLTDGEEVDHGTDPTKPDMDSDGLSDYEEVNTYVTDPTDADSGRLTGLEDDAAVRVLQDPLHDPYINETAKLEPYFEADNDIYGEPPLTPASPHPSDGPDSSGDGFSDAYSKTQDALTVDEKDIFIQVTYQNGTTIPLSALLRVQEAFENAPVENTAGEEVDINLHIYIDSEPVDDSTTRYLHYTQPGFTTWDRGHYQVYIVEEVYDPTSVGTQPVGIAYDDTTYGVLVQEGDSDRGQTIMHELGHELGLWPRVYGGIDARVPENEYPSVMNYNVDEYRFSNGTGHDDWSHIAEHLDENAPPTNRLNG